MPCHWFFSSPLKYFCMKGPSTASIYPIPPPATWIAKCQTSPPLLQPSTPCPWAVARRQSLVVSRLLTTVFGFFYLSTCGLTRVRAQLSAFGALRCAGSIRAWSSIHRFSHCRLLARQYALPQEACRVLSWMLPQCCCFMPGLPPIRSLCLRLRRSASFSLPCRT